MTERRNTWRQRDSALFWFMLGAAAGCVVFITLKETIFRNAY